MITALIFDCDGTLTDSMPIHYLAWREVMLEVDVEFTEKRFYELAGVPGTKVMQHIAAHLADDVQLQLLHQREQKFMEKLAQVKPIQPVVDIARQHRDSTTMAVASGSVRESVLRQLESIGVIDWFGAIVAAEDTERHKPEPDVFLEAANRLEVEPASCRVYEDSDLGIEAARRAGMEVVDVRPLYAHQQA